MHNMTKRDKILEQLLELTVYDPISGELYWKTRHHPAVREDLKVGRPCKNHAVYYKIVLFRGFGFQVHRVIWQKVTGTKPDVIDHINGNGIDNRMCNLRSVTNAENLKNSKRVREQGRTQGVVWDKYDNRWRARTLGEKQARTIGLFKTEREAVKALNEHYDLKKTA